MYKAVLFARNGDWVTDCKGKTKEEVIEQVVNLGSRWFFFPLILMIRDYGAWTTDNQRIVDVPEEPQYHIFRKKTIKTVSKMIKQMTDAEWLSLFGEA